MGGVLSCVRLPGHREKRSQESKTKQNQNEDIDDNFTILPSSAESKNTTNDDVTYENVSKTSLMNYEPKTRHDGHKTDEIQNRNGVDVTSPSQHDDGAQENVYVNCSMTSQQEPKSSPSEGHGGDTTSSNQNPANETKEKKKKSKTHKAPATKPKKKLFKVKEDEVSTKTKTATTAGEEDPASKGKRDKGKQLTYIEVEFASPPPPSATSAPKKNGGKSSPSSDSDPSSSTTYTDVVHEGGRLVLIT